MINKKGKIFIISGPSGSGKTTLYKKLLKSGNALVKSISVTTRPKRLGEQHGRDYFFVSSKMFLYKKRADHFLESEKVFDNYYGTPRKNVFDLLRKGKSVLLCIDVKGANAVCRKYTGIVRIFIKTKTIIELEKRLQKRGSEDSKTVNLRLKTAKEELKQAKYYNYIIINDNMNDAFGRLKNIITREIIS